MADEEKKDDGNIGSFYMGRMRPPPEPKRLLPPGVLTIFALAALGGIIWYAYPHGAERYTDVDVPVVKADTSPIKAAPENPGGMDVPHQDSTAFDPLTKQGGSEQEKLMPAAEQPMDKDQAIKTVQAQLNVPPSKPPKLDVQMKEDGNGMEEVVPAVPEAKPPVTASETASAPTPASKTEDVKPSGQAASDDIKAPPVAVPPKAEAKPVKPEKTATKAEDPKAGKSASPSSGSQYEVQLGSFRAMDDGQKEWAKLAKKYPSYLGGLKMRLVKADIPNKGTYYRLQAGSVSKDRAVEICNVLKADNHGCIRANK